MAVDVELLENVMIAEKLSIKLMNVKIQKQRKKKLKQQQGREAQR